MANLNHKTSLDLMFSSDKSIQDRRTIAYLDRFPPRSPLHKFLGTFAACRDWNNDAPSMRAFVAAHFKYKTSVMTFSDHTDTPVNYVLKTYFAPEQRSLLLAQLYALWATWPYGVISFDLSADDQPTSSWGTFLSTIQDRDFRVRSFHKVGSTDYCYGKEPKTCSHGSIRGVYIGNYMYSPHPILEVENTLEDKYRVTYATHLAAHTNCLNMLIDLLKTLSPQEIVSNLCRQDFITLSKEGLSGLTALHHAILGGHEKILSALMDILGEHIFEIVDSKGNTLLHTFATTLHLPDHQLLSSYDTFMEKFHDICPELERRQAFFQKKNQAGQTALTLAETRKNATITRRLMFIPGAEVEPVKFETMGIHFGKEVSASVARIDEHIALIDKQIQSLQDQIALLTKNTGMILGFLLRQYQQQTKREQEKNYEITILKEQVQMLHMGMQTMQMLLLEDSSFLASRKPAALEVPTKLALPVADYSSTPSFFATGGKSIYPKIESPLKKGDQLAPVENSVSIGKRG